MSRFTYPALFIAALGCSQSAVAGPPFLTDDPEPTQTGHWEIYAPLVEVQGRGAEYEGSAGVELNYGLTTDLQLTLGLPLDFRHDASGMRWGAGDMRISAKYRIVHDADSGFQLALFPGISLPTNSNVMGTGKVSALLPIWV